MNFVKINMIEEKYREALSRYSKAVRDDLSCQILVKRDRQSSKIILMNRIFTDLCIKFDLEMRLH